MPLDPRFWLLPSVVVLTLAGYFLDGVVTFAAQHSLAPKGVIGFLVLAIFILSLQDVAIKWIGGGYPVLEVVVFRNSVALPCTLLLFRLGRER